MTQQKIHATLEVGLPDNIADRAALFGRVAEAWSIMTSNVEDIARKFRAQPPTVTSNVADILAKARNGEAEKPKPKNKGGRPRKRRR